jgi:alpha-L-fucosidase
MAKYSQTSPYYQTPQNSINLGVLVPRTITADLDDQSYTIERTYAYRPDLLAYDLYGTPRLWWVFAQRNPDQIEDPIYDFRPGVTIQLPKPANISRDLGV